MPFARLWRLKAQRRRSTDRGRGARDGCPRGRPCEWPGVPASILVAWRSREGVETTLRGMFLVAFLIAILALPTNVFASNANCRRPYRVTLVNNGIISSASQSEPMALSLHFRRMVFLANVRQIDARRRQLKDPSRPLYPRRSAKWRGPETTCGSPESHTTAHAWCSSRPWRPRKLRHIAATTPVRCSRSR